MRELSMAPLVVDVELHVLAFQKNLDFCDKTYFWKDTCKVSNI
jgi:hypothetical protein